MKKIISRSLALAALLTFLTFLSACSLSGNGSTGIGVPDGTHVGEEEATNIGNVTDEAHNAGATTSHEHRFGVYPAKDSTCFEEGKTEGYGCLDCGYMIIHQGTISKRDHSYKSMPYIAPTCTSEGRQGGSVCSACGDVLSEPRVIPKLAHKEVLIDSVAPSCIADGSTSGTVCSVCNEVIKAVEVIPKNESLHKYVYTSEKNPTGRKAGCTAGIYCSVCDKVVLEAKEIPALGVYDHRAYEGDFGYYFLGRLDDGDKLCAFYDNIDASMTRFHNDTSTDVESNKAVAVLDYSSLGITSSQAITVWTVYRADHPLYYWISNAVGYSDFQMTVYTSEEFLLGSERKKINDAIYSGMLEISEKVPQGASEYEIAKAVHDHIVLGMDYAYMENGEPEEAIWAHSVVGFFSNKAGVCETYAKVFQLMLHFFDVRSIYVTGDAGNVKHAWNLVQMDDGYWYWFDLTWDDSPTSAQGFNYNYFCVTDDQPLRGGVTFASSHTYAPSTQFEINFVYTIPERSRYEYIKAEDRLSDMIEPLSSYQWRVSGDVVIKELERITHTDLTYKLEDVTLSEFILPLIKDIAAPEGYQISEGDVYILIESISGGKVKSVIITKKVAG